MSKGDVLKNLRPSNDNKFMGHTENERKTVTTAEADVPALELLKRKLFFDLKRDETMSMSEYLASSMSDRDASS
mgnify:FL=1